MNKLRQEYPRAGNILHRFSFRLAAAFSLIIVLMILAAFSGYSARTQVLSELQKLTTAQDIHTELIEIQSAILKQETRISQALVLNQPQLLQDSEHNALAALEDSLEEYKELAKRSADTAENQFIRELEEAEEQLEQFSKQITQNLQQANQTLARQTLVDFNKLTADLDEILTQKLNTLEQEQQERRRLHDQQINSGQILLLVAALSVGLVAIISAVSFSVWLGRKVKNLQKAVVGLGQGDLESRVINPGRDELGQVGHAFNQMAQQISDLIKNVETKRTLGKQTSVEVNLIVGQLSEAANQQTRSVEEQAAAVAQVTTTLEELGKTALNISTRASEVAEQASQTQDFATHLKQIAEETNHTAQESQTRFEQNALTINEVENQVDTIQALLSQLVEQSNRIDTIVEVIGGIANETHLLALNGAIEAAGAGEYGERFGVVAGEVKSLSTRSRAATVEIAQVVKEVQQSVGSLAEAVEKTAHFSHNSVQLSQEAKIVIEQVGNFSHEIDRRFGQIVEAMEGVTNLSGQIKFTTSEQSTANQQLIETMHTLNNTSQIVAVSSTQLAQTAQRLHNVSLDMSETLAA